MKVLPKAKVHSRLPGLNARTAANHLPIYILCEETKNHGPAALLFTRMFANDRLNVCGFDIKTLITKS